jgi:hypothetical protein
MNVEAATLLRWLVVIVEQQTRLCDNVVYDELTQRGGEDATRQRSGEDAT